MKPYLSMRFAWLATIGIVVVLTGVAPAIVCNDSAAMDYRNPFYMGVRVSLDVASRREPPEKGSAAVATFEWPGFAISIRWDRRPVGQARNHNLLLDIDLYFGAQK